MVVFNIKCESSEEMRKLRETICYGLKGSPAFVNNEIGVCDLKDDMFAVVLGVSNEHDIEYDLCGKDLVER